MGLLDDIEELFGVKTLYDVLGVDKTCPAAALKKAYRKQSLLCHPDKAREGDCREEFTKKFQTLSKCFDILHDEEKRKVYDDTGSVDDSTSSDFDWMEYWRNIFPEVTTARIDEFLDGYRDSEAEREDLKRHYERFKGDLNKISQYHYAYTIDDEDRICQLLKTMIAEDVIKDYDAFSKESEAKKSKRMKKFAREAKDAQAEKDKSKDADLALMIRQAQKQRAADFFANLEAKYAPKPKARKTAKKKKAVK